MRKLVVFLCLTIAALGALPSANAATTTKSITVPTVFNGTEATCLPNAPGCEKTVLARQSRCAYLADPVASQGVTGYVINVSGGSTYSLVPAAGSLATADFDVTFYQGLGTCSGKVGYQRSSPVGPVGTYIGEDPTPETRTDDWDGAKFGPDGGTIPAGATKAIITLFGAPNQTFTFKSPA